MDHITGHLNLLRQEINDLRNLNARYAETRGHTPVEKTAFESRQNRLSQIKQELLNMRNTPSDSAVWWDKQKSSQRPGA
jgi:hypothetical protein